MTKHSIEYVCRRCGARLAVNFDGCPYCGGPLERAHRTVEGRKVGIGHAAADIPGVQDPTGGLVITAGELKKLVKGLADNHAVYLRRSRDGGIYLSVKVEDA